MFNLAEVRQKDIHAFGSCGSVMQFVKRNQPANLDRKTMRNWRDAAGNLIKNRIFMSSTNVC